MSNAKKAKTCPSSSQHEKYLPIEDYALIGNLHTVALVGKNGSLDWCCLPRFDSPSVFGALLDSGKGGFFRIAPADMSQVKCQQLYLPESNIVLTRFLSEEGVGEMTEFMPIKRVGSAENHHCIIRSISIVHGSLHFTLLCRPGFHYAQEKHHLDIVPEGAIFRHTCFNLCLASPQKLEPDGHGGVQAHFTLHTGQSAHFLLESTDEREPAPHLLTEQEYQRVFQDTLRYWRGWLAQCQYQGRWHEMVQRSALVLKLLTYAPTGAIVAAPTTSLPEAIGGERNWDYRYTWLRDSAFSLYSLLTLGFTQEAEAFMQWLDARCHELRNGNMLQPMYGIAGEHELTEQTLDHWEGYRKSHPVRVGNKAYTQMQLDIYGELLDAIAIYSRYDAISYDLWQNLHHLLKWLSHHWQNPDKGMWEVRGEPRQFLHSRLMSWVAYDRAIRIARHYGWPAPIEEWIKMRSQIYQQIMDKGWNPKKQSFVQYYGSDALDASSLLMMITDFTGSREPRMIATIERIEQELASGALVRRYDPRNAANDGFTCSEGNFGACSFWLVHNLARTGRLDEARLLLERLLSYSNHVGLYAEEISPAGQALGNFPQAFTHLALITACTTLNQAINTHQNHHWTMQASLYG